MLVLYRTLLIGFISTCTFAAQIMHSTERLLRAGKLNKRYLEIFAMHDMQKLLSIFDDGKQAVLYIDNIFFVVLALNQLHKTSLQSISAPPSNVLSSQPSPPPSSRHIFVDELVILDAIMFVLSSSICAPCIQADYTPSVEKFASKLESMRENYMAALRRKTLSDTKELFLRIYEVWTVVSILNYTWVGCKFI